MIELTHETYSTAEAAAAIEHGSFPTFRRNFYSNGFNNLPLFSEAGRGQYTYGQIAEMALFLGVQASHPREVAKGIVWGIIDALIAKQVAAQNFNDALRTTAIQEDELEKAPHCPSALYPALLAPDAVFGGDTIARDPDNRTWALFSTRGADAGKARVELLQEGDGKGLTLKMVRECAVNLETEGSADPRTRYLMELPALTPNLIDLTGTFLRFEGNLEVHLSARSRGRR